MPDSVNFGSDHFDGIGEGHDRGRVRSSDLLIGGVRVDLQHPDWCKHLLQLLSDKLEEVVLGLRHDADAIRSVVATQAVDSESA